MKSKFDVGDLVELRSPISRISLERGIVVEVNKISGKFVYWVKHFGYIQRTLWAEDKLFKIR